MDFIGQTGLRVVMSLALSVYMSEDLAQATRFCGTGDPSLRLKNGSVRDDATFWVGEAQGRALSETATGGAAGLAGTEQATVFGQITTKVRFWDLS